MKLAARFACLTLLLGCGLALPSVGGAQVIPAPVSAPVPPPPRYENVISANPFGILLEIFNIEYERVITESSTLGLGGSYYSLGEEDEYLNADVFWRFYLQDAALEGWAFGAKIGLTNVPDEGTYPGIGFDMNHSWLLGRNDNFYLGAGAGLKRLFNVPDDAGFSLKFIPTIRIINVGIAF